VTEERTPTPPLPVGIPQFTLALDQVAAGLKPMLDGLDWLERNGYRTVLHIHPPGEDTPEDRRQMEKRNLKYVSLAVSPETLSRGMLDEFKRIVGDAAGHPLFVYDKDGTLAGGLWYLYFRTVAQDTDEAARARAARLGLKAEGDGAHKTMWLAVQKLLHSLMSQP
jgi:protein tyrosine phosphatase (PTP) superfamily phosphohydrolase (DUF442 family)